MAITGNGNASKEQVASMLKSLFNLQELPKHLDATDGLAAALCHHFQRDKSTNSKVILDGNRLLLIIQKRLNSISYFICYLLHFFT